VRTILGTRRRCALCDDNFYTGTRKNIRGLLSNSRSELIRHDICFPLYVEVDEIFNLACPASPETSIQLDRDPATTRAKRCAETLFFDYRRQRKLGIKVARR
jgi:hypothetical protein